MLQIPCPYCGVRDEDEYRFGGESRIAGPTLEADDAAWAGYLFNRINPKGIAFERWLHEAPSATAAYDLRKSVMRLPGAVDGRRAP